MSAEFRLNLIAHLCCDHLGCLENGLISQHEAHVAIHADNALLHAIDLLGKIAGNKVYAFHQLAADQRLGLVQILGIIGYVHVWRGIALAQELARKERM